MTTALRDGVGLAASWRLLSLGLAPPSEETLGEVETLAEALMEVDASPELADLLEAVRDVEQAEAAAQYSALFRGKVLVAPYEGSYELDPIRQGRQMADVAAFYRAFGAEAHGPAAERPDFVGCELEFLSFLELRRLAALEADEEGVEIVEKMRDAFLADHAGWLPSFFAEVRERSSDKPVYRALAALGAEVVESELERRKITCEPPPRRRERVAVERDGFDCG